MRVHVTEIHLHPLFLRAVSFAPDIMQARKAVLDWLLPFGDECPGACRRGFHQPGAHPGRHPGGDGRPLFGGRGGAPTRTPRKENCIRPCCSIGGCRHTWWVTSTRTPREVSWVVVGVPGQCWSLRAFTINRGPLPQVRQVVVVEGWTPEPPSDSPPKEASREEVATTEAAEEMTPQPEGAQALCL